MNYIAQTTKNMDLASDDLEKAVLKKGFGVLHVHDLQKTLKAKGVELADGCRIFEVCNPKIASRVLGYDMRLNMALPCRISVWQENENTFVGMISPQAILALISQSEELLAVADEVSEILKSIIDAAV